jgi:type II secretory pathway component GspD/PulD (secretin)
MPCNFEMREVGMILKVVPEVTAEGLIDVTVDPQWIALDRWDSHPADVVSEGAHRRLSFLQPVFGVTHFETEVTMEDGGTVLIGSSSTPDGEWVQVGFLTVRLVGQ